MEAAPRWRRLALLTARRRGFGNSAAFRRGRFPRLGRGLDADHLFDEPGPEKFRQTQIELFLDPAIRPSHGPPPSFPYTNHFGCRASRIRRDACLRTTTRFPGEGRIIFPARRTPR